MPVTSRLRVLGAPPDDASARKARSAAAIFDPQVKKWQHVITKQSCKYITSVDVQTRYVKRQSLLHGTMSLLVTSREQRYINV